ncbi:MAG: 1-deoxy-D-xylulose-5-phosphate reductoisomerase [Butyricicoccus sp.]
MKKLVLLGSTGSIGTQTIDVLDSIKAEVCAITVNTNIEKAEQQARQLRPKLVCVYDEARAAELKTRLADTDIRVVSGMDGLIEAATLPEADIVVTAVVGMVGLLPTLAAIDAGKTIALANKETLVCAGQLVMRRAREKGVAILPVDSEHSAIFQCLQGRADNAIRRILLTASGGPFFDMNAEQLRHVTKQQALHHPNWNMGAKITIDSATMFNKGLELIEAMWLYDVEPEQIDIVVHRESIVHSAVEYDDGSVIAQLGNPDMRLPIQYALTYPKRLPCKVPPLDLPALSRLTFFRPDEQAFPALQLAHRAAKARGNLGAVLNGANEAAVDLFLHDKILFHQIPELVAMAMDGADYRAEITVDDVLESDRAARRAVLEAVK